MVKENTPLLLAYDDLHLQKILKWRGTALTSVGNLTKVSSFNSYNNLLDINGVFSNHPRWGISDRSFYTQSPVKQRVIRPWLQPKQQWDLDYALMSRVKKLETSGAKINLFWSGGIDSTTAATAFLKHLTDRSQLRILYSPYSVYEHPEYLNFLSKFPEVELIDISGTVYLTEQFDGIFVTGEGGDELNASLDQSFFDAYGYEVLHHPWRDFFRSRNSDSNFIDFCEEYFEIAGRPIETVLHARWWFYAICKSTSILYYNKLPWFFDYPNFKFTDLVGFFDCNEYENYVYWNIEQIIPGNEYVTWKQNLKDYCYAFDRFGDWCKNKEKYNSGQLGTYIAKKIALSSQNWIFLLDDGTRISTPSLPVLTRKEFKSRYDTTLDYLFNEPDKI